MRYLLDTCVISELVRPRPEKKVVSWVARQDEVSLFLSVVSIGELQKGISKLPGAEKRSRLQRWVDNDLRRRFTGRILPIEMETALRWGRLAGAAEAAGHKLPVLDALLAATALENVMTLVTRNTGHFERTGVALLDPWNEA